MRNVVAMNFEAMNILDNDNLDNIIPKNLVNNLNNSTLNKDINNI